MSKTVFAVLAAVALTVIAAAEPASARAHCRAVGSQTCADHLARAKIGQVRTVYRTIYVQQVRDVYRVRNVYRTRVVHAAPAPRPRLHLSRYAAVGGHRAHRGRFHIGGHADHAHRHRKPLGWRGLVVPCGCSVAYRGRWHDFPVQSRYYRG